MFTDRRAEIEFRLARAGIKRVQADTQVFQQIAKFYNYEWFIVTAAVYRGFGRELHSYELTLFLNLPTPGRRQTLYFLLRVCRTCVFDKQSLMPIYCHPQKLFTSEGTPYRELTGPFRRVP